MCANGTWPFLLTSCCQSFYLGVTDVKRVADKLFTRGRPHFYFTLSWLPALPQPIWIVGCVLNSLSRVLHFSLNESGTFTVCWWWSTFKGPPVCHAMSTTYFRYCWVDAGVSWTECWVMIWREVSSRYFNSNYHSAQSLVVDVKPSVISKEMRNVPRQWVVDGISDGQVNHK